MICDPAERGWRVVICDSVAQGTSAAEGWGIGYPDKKRFRSGPALLPSPGAVPEVDFCVYLPLRPTLLALGLIDWQKFVYFSTRFRCFSHSAATRLCRPRVGSELIFPRLPRASETVSQPVSPLRGSHYFPVLAVSVVPWGSGLLRAARKPELVWLAGEGVGWMERPARWNITI
jgi:hypothetical protein